MLTTCTRTDSVIVDLFFFKEGEYITEDWQRVAVQGGVPIQTVHTVENLAAGEYDLRIGIFAANATWDPLLFWANTGALVTIGSTPPPTSIPGNECLGAPAYPEIRPNNTIPNMRQISTIPWHYGSGGDRFQPYYNKITGDCQGTTEQILEWAAIKWGFADLGFKDIFKAQAIKESWWNQYGKGDSHSGASQHAFNADGSRHLPGYPDGFQSYCILQIKRSVWPGSWEPWTLAEGQSVQSTGWCADYAGAVMRMHYDGQSWLGQGSAGNVWRAIGAWFCGCANAENSAYTNEVRNNYTTRRWTLPEFR